MGKSINLDPAATNPHVGPRVGNPRAVKPRNAIEDGADPYLPEGHYRDGTVCTQCGAVYQNQHWTLDPRKRDTLVAAGTPHQIVCPGCTKVNERNPSGVVTLRGDYWADHREDILNLIHNEEARGVHTNPLERIIEIREEEGCLVIETTNEKLAQRIGRSVGNAHKGHVQYKWPDGDRLVRVEWERMLDAA